VTLNQEVFFSDYGGGFGLVLAELSDGTVIATHVLPDKPAAQAGIKEGAQITQWNGQPVGQAIDAVEPGFGPYSTEHARRENQVVFLTRVPPDTRVEVTFQNPGGAAATKSMQAVVEYDSLFKSIPSFNEDKLALPVESEVLPDSGLGYIRINTFSDDYNLMARLWERAIQDAIDNEVPGLILDLRNNGGGSMGLAMDFAGFFFDKEAVLYQSQYYNANSKQFEDTDYPTRLQPAPVQYTGPVAVLVSSNCVSACEGFAYAMQHDGRAIIVGHTASAGAFGEVGMGQYKLPDDLNMQFPTGRSITPDGKLVIEGVGVVPDVLVPVTADSALGKVDAVLQAAIQAVLDKLP
jgi:carboxyl-terminal processing protease